jgi:hypothetical protein
MRPPVMVTAFHSVSRGAFPVGSMGPFGGPAAQHTQLKKRKTITPQTAIVYRLLKMIFMIIESQIAALL